MAGIFPSFVDKYFIVEIGLTSITWPAFFFMFFNRNSNKLINISDDHVYLTTLGVIIFYGGLLALSFLIPYLWNRLYKP